MLSRTCMPWEAKDLVRLTLLRHSLYRDGLKPKPHYLQAMSVDVSHLEIKSYFLTSFHFNLKDFS